jgi:hypothetical protein
MKKFVCVLALVFVIGKLSAQAPAGQAFGEGPVFVTALSQCYWLASVPTTTPAVAECFVDTGVPATSGRYFSLSTGPTIWTPEGTTLTKAAVLALGITVSVPAHPAQTGTLQ